MKSNKKIVVITGVTSFLGSQVARKFINNGYIVYGIIRPKSKRLDKIKDISGLNVIELDLDKLSLSDIEKFRKKVKTHHDITFFHFAWGATLDRADIKKQMLNVDYSMKVLKFAEILGAKRFIFAGSQAEYSESAYGIAKRTFGDVAEDYLKGSDMKFIHLRIFSIYGKGDRETTILMTLAKLIRENKDVDLSSCNYLWNFLHIDDFINIMKLLVENDVESSIYDIASEDTRLLKDYVLEAKNVLGGKNQLNFGARPDSKEIFAIPDISRLKKAIGDYQFLKFRSGIKMI